ncbi:MAG: amino acid ABC transporter substrate-binding protein [Reyranellaceae bacterium]
MTDNRKRAAANGIGRRNLLKTAAGVAAATYLPGLTLSTPAWAQKGVVKIGGSLPLTGTFEKVSALYRGGWDLWSKTVGNKMRVGDRELDVEWVVYDDEFNPARTAQLTERLISSDKVDLIVGTYGTDTVLAQGAIARRYNKLTIQAGAASARVDEEIGGSTTFTVVGSANVYPRLAMEFLAKQNPRPKTIATITYDDAAYKEMTVEIKKMAAELGIEHVLDIELPVNTQDLRPTVLRLMRAGNIDVVYSTGHDVPQIKLIQEAQALQFSPKAIFGGHLTMAPSVKQALKERLDYVYGVAMWLPQFPYKDTHFASCQAFADKYKEMAGSDPTYHVAMSYTIPFLYETILKDAPKENPFDPETMRKKLLALKDTPTIWGPVSFNERGRITVPGLPVIQWQGKDPQAKVVYPDAMADGKANYPTPAWSKRG